MLIFDEVKTGLTIAAGGATERFGVKPDMVTLAKALGGGVPTGAIGGSEEVFDGRRGRQRLPGRHLQRQPARHGGRAREPARGHDAGRPTRTSTTSTSGSSPAARASSSRYNLPGYAIGIAGKGCVTFSTAKVIDYETFKANQDKDLSELAWLFNMNRGIFMTPGREEEWTLSVTHTDESIDAYVAVFDEMAAELTR